MDILFGLTDHRMSRGTALTLAGTWRFIWSEEADNTEVAMLTLSSPDFCLFSQDSQIKYINKHISVNRAPVSYTTFNT